MEILNMNSQQTKPQEMAKISNSQIFSVKQRMHKFNSICNNSSIPVPSIKTNVAPNNTAAKKVHNNKNQDLIIKKNTNVTNNGHGVVSNNTGNVNDLNNNIKINIVNKYNNNVTSYTTTSNNNNNNNNVINNNNNNTKIISGNKNSGITNQNISETKIDINNNNHVNTSKVMVNAVNAGDVKIKINQLNQVSSKRVAPGIPVKSPSPIASLNSSGWIRVYCGPDRSEFSCEDPNRMVLVYSISTTAEVVKDMDLPSDYTLWVQIGGVKSRRLEQTEQPLMVQEDFLKQLGYFEESRRSRLGIDPDLKYLIRFHIGPMDISQCKGNTKCGNVELLKGLVFPQWHRRTIAVIGSKLIVYPGNPNIIPETYELSGAEIFEHTPVYNRLIIKIVPKLNDSLHNTKENLCRNKSVDCLNSSINNNNSSTSSGNSNLSNMSNNAHSSNLSVYSNGDRETREVVLFLGFEESWERDLWSYWLTEATTEVSEPRRMDITGSGLHIMPEIILHNAHLVEELFADHNKLQESALRALADFKKLRVLRISGNQFKKFPDQLMDIPNICVLDISKNDIEKVPDSVFKLEKLEELKIDDNLLINLPNTLKLLRNLKSLQVSNNRISKLPDFMVAMRFNNGLDYGIQNKFESAKITLQNEESNTRIDYSNPPLTKLNLRANHLKGNIILGNFAFLTQLDMSENSIEILDLSALDKIESIQCCRNQIKELTINGRVLNSLVASNNNLSRLIVKPLPKNLRHVDVSYNHLTEVPDWLHGCHQLRTLYANNNNISTLPDNLFHNENGMLHTIQLACNKLTRLPSMPRRLLPLLQELYVNGNEIEDLPEHFFIACENLILLNVSSNKLLTLPMIDGNKSQLERLYATNNCLSDRVLDTLFNLHNLRILHLSYNRLTTFPESCVSNWTELEELNLSGNKLQHLPDNLCNLKHLRVLRVHSNQLQSTPMLAKIASLRVLDLAHNQLDKINLVVLVPKKLQFLDLSCNKQLQVDAKQLQTCRSQRPMSLVDVSGKNRATLPTAPSPYQENPELEPPWKIGFSETSGNANKLYISQLRLPGFCNTEGLFGLFDGESNNTLPNLLVKAVPKILLEERTVKETAADYMKYTLLSAHRELKQLGQKSGVCATLCHISRSKITTENSAYHPFPTNGRRFILRVASVGEASAVLIRQNGAAKLTSGNSKTKIGSSYNFPANIPNPEYAEVLLGETDEYLVLANKKLWDVMSPADVGAEIKREENVLLAAKRLQDVAQSYGAEENISIILVKFNNLGTDIDFLMRELRHTIRKKPTGTSVISGFCKCGCCCESNNSCCHSGAAGQFNRHPSSRSDRSSPSGQSDQASISDNQLQQVPKIKNIDPNATVGSAASKTFIDKKNLRSGMVRAVRARIEEEKERENGESDSVMSEEQFKCWEYMLEQNTQLLFDKELNTISKAFTKRNQSNLNRKHVRSLSTSSPAIAQIDPKTNLANFSQFASMLNQQNTNPSTTPTAHFNALNIPVEMQQSAFLSKHFGSARSFQPQTQNFFKPIRKTSAVNAPRMNLGGPNAAYFGSLQRLMPYNLEYDFAMIQERPGLEEVEAISEQDSNRMQQYWGVATTEL